MKAVFCLLIACLLLSCANITSPTGGPKDTLAPQLYLDRMIPQQGQTNFKGKRIVLEFDEYLKLKNPKEEIIITPDIKNVKFTAKKNIFYIDIDEDLKDSTTYSIAFREAIQDLNEGNATEDLHLAFSTGAYIDSLELSGHVSNLLRANDVDKYTVAIYASDTFDIFKHSPVYFTRTNKLGKFRIQNLKPGIYYVYSFEDKNKNLLLESRTERFAFLPTPISLTANIDSITLRPIALDSRPITITGIRPIGHLTKVRLNKNLINYKIALVDQDDNNIRSCFSSSQSEIDIFPTQPPGDSTLIHLTAIDSLQQQLDSTFYIKQTDARSLREKIKINIINSQLIEDTRQFTAEIQSSELITSLNTDSIYLQIDSLNTVHFTLTDFNYDTIFRRLSITKEIPKFDSVDWKKTALFLGASFLTSIHGDSSLRATKPIIYISKEETAILKVEITTSHTQLLIQLLDDRFATLQAQPFSKSMVFKNIKPGSVILRAIIDSNQNGKWDPGNPVLKIPPERVIIYKNTEGKQLIPLRANWELTEKWNIP